MCAEIMFTFKRKGIGMEDERFLESLFRKNGFSSRIYQNKEKQTVIVCVDEHNEECLCGFEEMKKIHTILKETNYFEEIWYYPSDMEIEENAFDIFSFEDKSSELKIPTMQPSNKIKIISTP